MKPFKKNEILEILSEKDILEITYKNADILSLTTLKLNAQKSVCNNLSKCSKIF